VALTSFTRKPIDRVAAEAAKRRVARRYPKWIDPCSHTKKKARVSAGLKSLHTLKVQRDDSTCD
jgi:hypothetical protein